MGRSINFNPEHIIRPTPESPDNVLKQIEKLKVGDIVEFTISNTAHADHFPRCCSTYYCKEGRINSDKKMIVTNINVDPDIYPLRAIMLNYFDSTDQHYFVEYLTTDGFIRDVEGCSIISVVMNCKFF